MVRRPSASPRRERRAEAAAPARGRVAGSSVADRRLVIGLVRRSVSNGISVIRVAGIVGRVGRRVDPEVRVEVVVPVDREVRIVDCSVGRIVVLRVSRCVAGRLGRRDRVVPSVQGRSVHRRASHCVIRMSNRAKERPRRICLRRTPARCVRWMR